MPQGPPENEDRKGEPKSGPDLVGAKQVGSYSMSVGVVYRLSIDHKACREQAVDARDCVESACRREHAKEEVGDHWLPLNTQQDKQSTQSEQRCDCKDGLGVDERQKHSASGCKYAESADLSGRESKGKQADGHNKKQKHYNAAGGANL